MNRETPGIAYRVIRQDHPKRKEVEDFIEAWGQKWHGCSPPPTTGDVIAAWKEEEIVGTVGLDFSEHDKPFHLESIYDFSLVRNQLLPGGEHPRSLFVAGGRWFARRPNVSRMLLHTIAEYCSNCTGSATYLLAEAKTHSLERIEQFGIPFLVIYGLPPSLDTIPAEGLKYYAELPIPRLMIIRLADLRIEGLTLISKSL